MDKMKKIVLVFLIYFFLFSQNICADEVSFTLEIHGVAINGGTIYIGIFSNDITFKNNQPEYTMRSNPNSDVISFNVKVLAGNYAIKVYQDSNNNGRLDTGLFGIPKEPSGISNWDGRGFPGNFDKHKVIVNNGTIITITLQKF